MKVRFLERGRGRGEDLPPAGSLPRWLLRPFWKPGARNIVWHPTGVTGSRCLGYLPNVLPRPLPGSQIGSGVVRVPAVQTAAVRAMTQH